MKRDLTNYLHLENWRFLFVADAGLGVGTVVLDFANCILYRS